MRRRTWPSHRRAGFIPAPGPWRQRETPASIVLGSGLLRDHWRLAMGHEGLKKSWPGWGRRGNHADSELHYYAYARYFSR